ncbi:MAG: Calx-beta domain-containing protein, partial [Planctomycetota bacterium]
MELRRVLASVSFEVMEDWGSGFTGQIAITNNRSHPIEEWQLEFDFDRSLSSIWNAEIDHVHLGRYSISGLAWNRSIPVGQQVVFGFTADPGNVVQGPHHYVVNGSPAGQISVGISDSQAIEGEGSLSFVIQLSGASELPVQVDFATRDETAIAGDDYIARNGSLQFEPGETIRTVSIDLVDDQTVETTETFELILQQSSVVIADSIGRGSVTDDDQPRQDASWPDSFFAPYVDATAWPVFDLAGVAEHRGVRHYNLGFVVAEPGTGDPSWGGYYPADGQYLGSEIAELRALGGDVMISFGGAANTELAVAVTDVDALTSAYQSVIDAYSLTHIDFDVEGAWLAHRPSIDRRSRAIANLQLDAAEADRKLSVWFTLPVLPTGLTPDGLYVLRSALAAGVAIDGVNIMAMNYGDAVAPDPIGRMGEYAIEAAKNLQRQMSDLYSEADRTMPDALLWKMIGVTPMIGRNDVVTETFNQQDARDLLAFAASKEIAMLSMWSANRDNACPGSLTYVSPSCSSIDQQPFEFTDLLLRHGQSPEARVSISSIGLAEGDQGQQAFSFEVTLSNAVARTVTMNFETIPGTATESVDYQATSGTLTFSPGETEKTVTVMVEGDTIPESDESFSVALREVSGVETGSLTGLGTIRDDDTPTLPTLVLDAASVIEGDSETTALTFPVRLTEAITAAVSVDYRTIGVEATAGVDYVETQGTLVFEPGETRAQVSVEVIGDLLDEIDETLLLEFSNIRNARLSDTQALGRIRD